VSYQNGSSLPTLSLEPTQKAKHIASVSNFCGSLYWEISHGGPSGFGIWPGAGVTGDFTTRNFAIYDKPVRLKCLGVQLIGNFGSVRRILIIRVFNLRANLYAIILRMLLLDPLFPGGFVGIFIGVLNAKGCNFQHKCFKSGVVHPAVRYNFRPSRTAINSTPSAQNSAQPTPVHIDKLRPLLCGCDVGLASMLYYVLKYGFPLHSKGARSSFFANNLEIIFHNFSQNHEIVIAKLFKECQANRLAGPFDHPPFVKFLVSPLGVVPKKALGEYRLIRHLSLPSGDSVLLVTTVLLLSIPWYLALA
jgi:hypothetical protein